MDGIAFEPGLYGLLSAAYRSIRLEHQHLRMVGTEVVICLLSPREVMRIGVEDRLVFLYTAHERFLVDRTVAELETMLSPQGFFRVSRSEIVNLQNARELIPGSSGTWPLILSNGLGVEVSRERARDLRAAMGFENKSHPVSRYHKSSWLRLMRLRHELTEAEEEFRQATTPESKQQALERVEHALYAHRCEAIHSPAVNHRVGDFRNI